MFMTAHLVLQLKIKRAYEHKMIYSSDELINNPVVTLKLLLSKDRSQ